MLIEVFNKRGSLACAIVIDMWWWVVERGYQRILVGEEYCEFGEGFCECGFGEEEVFVVVDTGIRIGIGIGIGFPSECYIALEIKGHGYPLSSFHSLFRLPFPFCNFA